MACLEMYNSSPRISFSYDFVESHQFTNSATRPSSSSSSSPPPPLPPASSDFEFSVSNHNMMCADMICADELFSKGKLLPFKYSNTKNRGAASGGGGSGGATTLRDELLTSHEDDEISTSSSAATFSKPPKSSGNRWKGFLGLRKSHIGSKKPEKTDESLDRGTMGHQPKSHAHPGLDFDPDPLYNMTSQEMVSDGCPSSRDVEMVI